MNSFGPIWPKRSSTPCSPNSGEQDDQIAPIDAAWQQRLGPVASDPAGFDREAFHEALSEEIVAFFERSLKP